MEKPTEMITIPKREYDILNLIKKHSIELNKEILELYTNEEYPSKKYLKVVRY
jgi:hypothetical protein